MYCRDWPNSKGPILKPKDADALKKPEEPTCYANAPCCGKNDYQYPKDQSLNVNASPLLPSAYALLGGAFFMFLFIAPTTRRWRSSSLLSGAFHAPLND